jgi:LPS-assembly protein
LSQDAFVNYQDDVWHFNGMVQKYQTLDNLSYAYSRLPQLTLSAYKEYNQFDVNFFSQYTYFDRNDNAPTTATGSRLLAYPSISVPFGNSYGFLTPKIGLNMASYRLSDNNYTLNGQTVSNNSQDRILPVLSLDGGLYYDASKNYFGTQYTQTLEPRMFYVYTPYKDQSQLPVFDSGISDLNLTSLFNENQYTGGDRVNNANQVSLALTTRLIDDKTGIERIAATLGQRFYFEDQKVTLPTTTISTRSSSDIMAGFTANLTSKLKVNAFWQYNQEDNNLRRSNVLARYNPEPGKLFNIGYRYTEGLLEQFDTSAQWPLGQGWYGVGRFNYSLKENKPIETVFGLEYDKGCWQLRTVVQRLETATANANYSFFVQLELGGIASIGSNPLNLLRRDIPGYLTTSQIPDYYRQQNYAQ